MVGVMGVANEGCVIKACDMLNGKNPMECRDADRVRSSRPDFPDPECHPSRTSRLLVWNPRAPFPIDSANRGNAARAIEWSLLSALNWCSKNSARFLNPRHGGTRHLTPMWQIGRCVIRDNPIVIKRKPAMTVFQSLSFAFQFGRFSLPRRKTARPGTDLAAT